jgi:hypothetical protein
LQGFYAQGTAKDRIFTAGLNNREKNSKVFEIFHEGKRLPGKMPSSLLVRLFGLRA